MQENRHSSLKANDRLFRGDRNEQMHKQPRIQILSLRILYDMTPSDLLIGPRQPRAIPLRRIRETPLTGPRELPGQVTEGLLRRSYRFFVERS
jgi:hypothetical protein